MFGILLEIVLIVATSVTSAQENCTPSLSVYGWKTDFCKHSVAYEEIVDVIPRDAIPAILDPQFETIEKARDWLVDPSPVIAVAINGEARAYPQAILIWHEIVNDTVGGVPIAVTFCPLCNSSIAFDRRVGDRTLTFGVSGKLRNSDLIMYDHQTDSWWQQFTGEGVAGQYSDTQLKLIPSLVIGFGEFAKQYPQGRVLSRETGESRSYGENPYQYYDSGESPFLFFGKVDPRLPAMEHVLAGVIGGEPMAYPFQVLSKEVVINDAVGGIEVVALWQGGVNSALDASNINTARDIGTAALYRRTLDGQTLTFSLKDSVIHDDQTGSVWNVWGEAIDGKLKGKRLEQELAAPHFWFAWAAFRPATKVYRESAP